MSGQLEEKVYPNNPLTLQQELKQSIREYPNTWKEYAKKLAPAIIVSSAGAAFGQWAATKLGYEGKVATTTASYICGYIPGCITFFGLEYFRNSHKYPGLLSKEFGEFVGTFMAADYVADLSTFTPAFIAANVWLTDNTELSPATRGAIAWSSAGLLYISAMSALHPLTRRITSSINKGIKAFRKKVFKNK